MGITLYANSGYACGAFNPAAPFPVLVQASAGQLALSWSPVPGAVGYSVYAGVRDDSMVPVELGTTDTTSTLTALDQPSYAAKIIADMGDGSSVASYLVRSGIAAVGIVDVSFPEEGEALLEFDDVPGAVGYNIYYGPAANDISPVPLPQRDIPGAPWALHVDTGFLIQGLPTGGDPHFFVQAIYKDCIAVSIGGSTVAKLYPWEGTNTHIGAITSTTVGNVVDTRSISDGDVDADTEICMKMRAHIVGTNGQKFLRIASPQDATNALLLTIPQGATGDADLEFRLLANGGPINIARMAGRLNAEPFYASSRGTVAFNPTSMDWNLQAQAWIANAGDSITVDAVSVTTIVATTQD